MCAFATRFQTMPQKHLSKAEVEEIFAALSRDRPEPQTELEYCNPFTLLVAVVLSAQATDAGVNKATRGLFAIADTAHKMVELGLVGIEQHIKTIGLYRNKAKNVLALSKIVATRYGGDIPKSREELEALPGVGRKTANVVLNVVFGLPTIAVDTHVFRVSNRIGLTNGKTPEAVEAQLERVIPAQYMQHAHHWLILHGRYLCKARAPECPRCPIAHLCRWPEKNLSGNQEKAKTKGSNKNTPPAKQRKAVV